MDLVAAKPFKACQVERLTKCLLAAEKLNGVVP
jgi:hypothetical protein